MFFFFTDMPVLTDLLWQVPVSSEPYSKLQDIYVTRLDLHTPLSLPLMISARTSTL
jgi:hypothetical protein